MPTHVENSKILPVAPEAESSTPALHPTVVGWQAIRFTLPPEWNVVSFSMDADNGHLRVDAPGNSTLAVLVRWMNAAKQEKKGPPNFYTLIAPRLRKWRKQPEPEIEKPDIKAILEKILKDTAKQAKKAKASFDSSLKSERIEGDNDERTAINFSWTGEGRGQGKIWYCAECNRVVVAQVIGMAKDYARIPAIASQIFGSFQDHAQNGLNLWALYDLQLNVPESFRVEAQKLLSGYLHLTFARGGERISIDRWGLANITRKKFTLEEWLANHALVNLKRAKRGEGESAHGHEVIHFAGKMSPLRRLQALRETRLSLQKPASRYEAGLWQCDETNKIFAIQTLLNAKTESLWAELVDRCVCHEEKEEG